MNFALEDIKPLKKQTPSKAGGRPSYWRDDVPAMYSEMLRHRLNEREMADLFGIPAATLKSWIHGKETMKKARMLVEAERAGEGHKHRDDNAASYEEHLKSGQIEAVQALRRIIHNGNSDGAIVSAANALLDRALGKPGQSLQIEKKETVTHEYLMKLPPVEAYRRLIGADIEIIMSESSS